MEEKFEAFAKANLDQWALGAPTTEYGGDGWKRTGGVEHNGVF